MIPYILHVTVILTVCFLFYKLVLQKATFYRLNRWTLLGCLVLSFVLPLLPAPPGWTWNPMVAADPVVAKPAVPVHSVLSASSTDPIPPATGTTTLDAATPASDDAALHAATAVPRASTTTVPRTSTAAITPPSPPTPSHPFRYLLLQGVQLLFYFYCLGLLVFGLKFVMQILLLCYRAFTRRPVIRDGRYRIVQTSDDRGPCTFANTIFINPSLYEPETFQQILVHEKIHVSGGHTLDILMAELAVVFQWFNPFVWWYRREVENNLEFLTDRSVLEHPYIERSAYQLSLLRVSAPHLPFSITNNYNQSLLKRRIVMMNSQHSARHTIWKYFVLLPILTVLVCTLNKPAALGQSAQANARPRQAATASQAILPTTATSSDTAAQPVRATARIAEPANISVTPAAPAIGAPTANPAAAIFPAAPMPDTTGPRSSDDHIHYIENANIQPGSFIDVRQGSWFLTVDSNDLEFTLRAQSGDNTWRSSFTVKKGEIDPYPGQGTVEFKLVRDAGTMTFKGSFDGEQGLGHFQFQPNETYFSELKKMGVEGINDQTENSFFVVNVAKEFVRMLDRNGYTPITEEDVLGLVMRRVDEPFLKYWKSSGIEGADQVHNLFMLKILHIDPAYVDQLKKAGYAQLTVEQLIRLKRQDIDGNYVRAMSLGNPTPVAPEELLLYKMMRIDSGYLNSLKKVGYDHLNQSEIRMLYNAHVTADYIKAFQEAGFSNIPANKLADLKIRNASPEDAKSYRRLGYADLDIDRITLLKNEGITPDFVDAFHKIGYDNIPVGVLFMLKTTGVDADYVARMKKNGLNSPDLRKYVQLKREFN